MYRSFSSATHHIFFPPRFEGVAFQQQAQVYAKLFDIFNRHSNSVSRVTFWGISDSRSWRAGQAALVYDGQLNPKPAYQAIMDVANKK